MVIKYLMVILREVWIYDLYTFVSVSFTLSQMPSYLAIRTMLSGGWVSVCDRFASRGQLLPLLYERVQFDLALELKCGFYFPHNHITKCVTVRVLKQAQHISSCVELKDQAHFA